MIDVSKKATTLRRAKAEAILAAKPETVARVLSRAVPKGDVLEVARAAGVLAAKRTAELIPLCHPIPLDHVSVEVEPGEGGLRITASVTAIWRTGVEMEALVGASTAALTAYDMLKPFDEALEIRSVRLLEKRGGRSDYRDTFETPLRAAILVTSDGTFAGKREDRARSLVAEMLRASRVEVVDSTILPDDADAIERHLRGLCDREDCELIFTAGGTGLGPRDVTVEATERLIERRIPGVSETARSYGQDRGPYAMLSRGVAGLRGRTPIVNLPGSTNGVRESLEALLPGLLHAFPMMRGGGHGA